jgi:SAM-dependent methyltransferase
MMSTGLWQALSSRAAVLKWRKLGLKARTEIVFQPTFMEYNKADIERLYLSGAYLRNNPTLHSEDSAWKAKIIYPFLDRFVALRNAPQWNLLDVGGGAGLLLRMIGDYLTHKTGRSVVKCALEYSTQMLEIQKANNPDLACAQQGSIEMTAFTEKQFDLVLLIDVLEHLPDDRKAMKEIRRICEYAIIKIPLEDTLHFRLMNALRRGALQRHAFESVGHVNCYSVRTYRKAIEECGGEIVFQKFTNIFQYFLTHSSCRSQMQSWQYAKNSMFAMASKVAPRLTARVVRDHVVMLVHFPC